MNRKYSLCMNMDDKNYMKQFIFPSFKFNIKQRVTIIKTICYYIKMTRPDIVRRYQTGLCKRIKDSEHIKKYGLLAPE